LAIFFFANHVSLALRRYSYSINHCDSVFCSAMASANTDHIAQLLVATLDPQHHRKGK